MNIISCVEAVKKIFELLGGKIKTSEKKQLKKHLKTCHECCNRLEFEKLLKEKLIAVNRDKKIPDSLEKRIHNILRNF